MHAAFTFCALVLTAQAVVAHGQQTPQLAPPRTGFSFPQKQTLTYSVDWRVFPAGTAIIHFEATGDRERITANADTIGAINLLFHVGDRFQSTFDRQKGCTYEFDKQTVEGRRQINSTLKLDYGQGKSILDEKNQVTGQTKHLESSIPSCLTDLLTGVFYASSQPMELGHTFAIPVVDALHTVPVTMKVEGREEIKTTLGDLQDPARAAYRRCRCRQEPGEYLGLVYRRRAPPARPDARPPLLGHYHLPAYRQRKQIAFAAQPLVAVLLAL